MQIPLLKEIREGFEIMCQSQKPDDSRSVAKVGLAVGMTLGNSILIVLLIASLWNSQPTTTDSTSYDAPAQRVDG